MIDKLKKLEIGFKASAINRRQLESKIKHHSSNSINILIDKTRLLVTAIAIKTDQIEAFNLVLSSLHNKLTIISIHSNHAKFIKVIKAINLAIINKVN